MAEAANRQIDLAEAQFADYQNNERPWMRGIADQAIGLSRDSAALARDQFGFSRDVANRQLGMAQTQVDRSNALADYQLGQMRLNDQRYRDVAVPFEDRLIADVDRFDSAGYKQGQVNAARADVQEAFGNAQQQGLRSMMRRGINPNSYNFASAAAGGDLARATAMASAANKTRMAADQVGLSTRMQMYGGMKGMAGLGATNAGLASGAIGTGFGGLNAGVGAMGIGNSAIGAMQGAGSGMMSAGTGYLGANNAAFSGMNAGMSAGITGLGNFTQLGQRATEINNAADPMGTILGAATGAGMAYLTGGLSTMGKNAGWAK